MLRGSRSAGDERLSAFPFNGQRLLPIVTEPAITAGIAIASELECECESECRRVDAIGGYDFPSMYF